MRYTWIRGKGPYFDKLGELQTKILKHMLSCDARNETVSHISKEINALQPDVFRSTKVLIEEGIIEKTDISGGNKRILTLTDYGVAMAVLIGIKHKKLIEYLRPKTDFNESANERDKILDIIFQLGDHTTKEDIFLKMALEFMMTEGWYTEEKKILTQEEKINLLTYLIPHLITETKFKANSIDNIVELIDKFGIDRERFGQMLLDRLNYTLEAVNKYGRHTRLPQVIASFPGVESLTKNTEDLAYDIKVASDIRNKLRTDKENLQKKKKPT